LVIHDFRSAALGRLTLETPEEFTVWLVEGHKADAERAIRKEAIEKAKKRPRKSQPNSD
jgi:ribosome biogenesis GTPase A